jgi:hypothetical protein
MRPFGPTLLLLAALNLMSSAGQAGEPPYLQIVRRFADTLLEKGRDRYGPKNTAMWLSVISVEDFSVPRLASEVPATPGVRDSDRAVGGSNLYLDRSTLYTLRVLSQVTGDDRYTRAVDAYVRDYLANCQSAETGLLAWGEHLYYDVFLDRVVSERSSHELLEWTPPWDLLWEVDPAAATRAMAGLRYHFRAEDPATQGWLFNRHAAWARPAYTNAGGQPWIKHSGLFAHAFGILAGKTNDAQWRRWATGVGNLYWGIRHPQTGLTESCIGDQREMSRCTYLGGMSLLSYFLLKGYHADPEQRDARDHALVMLRALDRYAWDSAARRYREWLTTDGAPPKGMSANDITPNPWVFAYCSGSSLLRFGRVAAFVARTEKDGECLAMARRAAAVMQVYPVPDKFTPEEAGFAIHLPLDLYDLTGEPAYLEDARKLARTAVGRLWAEGLFRRLPGDPFYENKLGPGELASALLRLALRTEAGRKDPAVWDWSF